LSEAGPDRPQPRLDPTRFILAETLPLTPPLVPEITLRLASEAVPLWQRTEEELGEMGLPPPFWAFAWAGGQALARYVLDTPDIVRGQTCLDLATGSGLVAIAAMKAGATSVLATDLDPFAIAAAAFNAEENGVALDLRQEDVIGTPTNRAVILVGDLFYERDIAARLADWLEGSARAGRTVLIGDPGRSYLPKDRLEPIAAYRVPVTRDLEDAEIKHSQVWRFRSG